MLCWDSLVDDVRKPLAEDFTVQSQVTTQVLYVAWIAHVVLNKSSTC